MQSKLICVFMAARIPIFEGYGLTKTSPAIIVNDLQNKGLKIGTVGKILKDLEVKIAQDGEILIKVTTVMMGYYKNEEMTNKTVINGHLHTGDVGEIDADRCLTFRNQKKEIFKTSGENILLPQF
jgi:long-chain acyl-CoA synthetase